MEQTLYNIFSTLVFIFLSTIWQKSTWVNTLIKYTFVIMSIAGIFICLKDFGFMIKF